MTITPDTNEPRRAFGAAVINLMAEVQTLINSQPELWIGGLPNSLVSVHESLNYQKRHLAEAFDLALNAPPAPEIGGFEEQPSGDETLPDAAPVEG